MHEGQRERPLQENGSNLSKPQSAHLTRAKPRASCPQAKKRENSRRTWVG